jgi:hypothetical protein
MQQQMQAAQMQQQQPELQQPQIDPNQFLVQQPMGPPADPRPGPSGASSARRAFTGMALSSGGGRGGENPGFHSAHSNQSMGPDVEGSGQEQSQAQVSGYTPQRFQN